MVSLKNVGTTDWSSDMLKMSAKTSASLSAHTLRAQGLLLGPGALRMLIHLKALHTCALDITGGLFVLYVWHRLLH